MQCLVLDVDALSHASGLKLLPVLEIVIGTLPDRAVIERSVYTEARRSGLGNRLDAWHKLGLLKDPIDYKQLSNGEFRFREARTRWKALSRQDCASLILAEARRPSGILTCERLLGAAATELRIFHADLFDVIRLGLRIGHLTSSAAATLCASWDGDRFSAGRPHNYRGSAAVEQAYRDENKPLP